jgi:hypothetical protein
VRPFEEIDWPQDHPPVLSPVSVVVGSWLVEVLSSLLFCALNGQADAAPAKANSVTKPKTNMRSMDPALRLIFQAAKFSLRSLDREALF